jgi:hypothetical protein
MPSKHTPYFNLLDALRAPGCALCRLGHTSVGRYLDGMLFEGVNKTDTQEGLKAAHGYCPAHAEQLLRHRDTLGTAILYNAVLGHLLKELPADVPAGSDWLDRLSNKLGRGGTPTTPLDPHAPCPACLKRDEAAERALAIIREHVGDAELTTAIMTSAGLCLPHLRQALTILSGPALQPILARQQQVWDALRSQLAELIRKNDYRFRDEAVGEEGDSWQRAVRATIGEPGIF